MTIVVGTVAGDVYDLYARAIALTMGKYLSGNPNIIVQNMPDAPTVYELLDKYKTPELGRRLATALLAPGEFHRPYVGPPNLRPEHVKMLREAFGKTMKDPGFLAEASKKRLDINPTSGAEVEALVREVMSQPKDVIERLKVLMGH